MKAKLIYKGEKIEKNGQFKKQSFVISLWHLSAILLQQQPFSEKS